MKHIAILLLTFSCVQADAQLNLSVTDSIALNNYMDSAFSQELFSARRRAYLDSALAVKHDFAYAWQQRAMPLFKQQKYELAMPYLDSAVKYDTKNHWLEYRAFMKCIYQKDYSGALKDFYTAKRHNSDGYVMDHPYDFYIGLCYLQLNNFDSCAILMNKCIDAKRKANGDNWVHYLHWFYLGVATSEQGDYKKAIQCFDNSLALYKQFSDAQYHKAICYVYMKDYAKALELMEATDTNLKQGYTMNEDNSLYETYPYQVNKFFLNSYVNWLRKEVN